MSAAPEGRDHTGASEEKEKNLFFLSTNAASEWQSHTGANEEI